MWLLWIFLAIVVVLVIWGISTQNELVGTEEFCKNSLSQIGVQQQSRWDALTALFDLTKGYSTHESETLEKVIAGRRNVSPTGRAEDIQAQENLLSRGFASINAVAEAYPDLKANSTYMKTMESVNGYENNVRMSRMVYNDTVTKFNRLIRAFPGSLIASMLRFGKKEYLETPENKTDMPNFK